MPQQFGTMSYRLCSSPHSVMRAILVIRLARLNLRYTYLCWPAIIAKNVLVPIDVRTEDGIDMKALLFNNGTRSAVIAIGEEKALPLP